MENKEEQSYLDKLLSLSDNRQFIPFLLEHPFINDLNTYLKENPDLQLTDLSSKFLELSEPFQSTPKSYLELIKIIYQVYVRENIVGPSVYTQYVDETKAPIIKSGPLPESPLDPISNKNNQLQGLLLQHFMRSSENIYLKTQFLTLFYALETLLENIPNESFKEQEIEFLKYRARFYYLWDLQLTSSVVHLQDQSINEYEKYVENLKTENLDELIPLLIEQSYCYLNFYKYKKSKQCIKKAMQLLNLNLKLTGKLGRRTKYQEFDIAQLVLDVENREVLIQPTQQPIKVINQLEDEESKGEEQHKNVQLEEESILFETPLLTDSIIPEKKELSVLDQIVIQAYINYITKTHAKDDTRIELLAPYISVCLQKSNNWLVYSKALLLRSRNEMEKSKTQERAMLQIQALIDQYRDRQPELGIRTKYVEACGYPVYWQLQKELAQSYMKMGVYVSAYELLREVELYEDCILAMYMAGRSGLAEELANERLQKGDLSQPTILCLLGDMKKDPTYYEKAWEVSSHKSGRAMRSRARAHYFNGEYQKSADCYEKALAISRLYPDSWFTLGCAYMRLEDFKQAIYSFGVAISIDEQNCEAWSNISTCHMRLEKYKEAVMCLEQALKHNRKNWKLWENYIILSLETLKFYKAVSASRELLRLDMLDRINVTLMLKICDVFLKNYMASNTVKPSDVNLAKKQLYAFFDEYTSKVAKDWQVWRLIGRIKGIMKEDLQEVKELKLKEIRALQEISWEHDIEKCEKVERSLDELMKLRNHTLISNEERVFVKNTARAIEECLQRKCNIDGIEE